MKYYLLASMLLVTAAGEENITRSGEICRNVNYYQVTNLHQTCSSCGSSGSGHGAATEDIKKQLETLQARVQALENVNNKTGSSRSCPGTFTAKQGSKCYHFSTVKVEFLRAYVVCRSSGAQLVSIESVEENTYLHNYIRNTPRLTSGDFWTSGTDLAEEGVWFWAGSGKLTLQFGWNPGQPNGGRSQNHLVLWKATGWTWHDVPPTYKSGYICEMSL